MDGETFGHHIKNYERTFLKKVLELIKERDKIRIVFISELDKYFPLSDIKLIPRESSWSTNYGDIKAGVPYPLWKHPDNNIHKYYWKLMKSLQNLMALGNEFDLTTDWEIENYYKTARFFYDRGIYSCPVWWANPHRGTWSPNLIYRGVELLMRAALNIQMALVQAKKSNLGERYFDSISYYQGLLLMELYDVAKKKSKN